VEIVMINKGENSIFELLFFVIKEFLKMKQEEAIVVCSGGQADSTHLFWKEGFKYV
jgi:hypothetical protein